MKRIFILLIIICLSFINSNAQLQMSKFLGKDASKFGVGYGAFVFYNFPLSTDNKSIYLELMDFEFFPTKGENLFTSRADMKSYFSIKLGYKYVFSDTKTGFYILPSAGYCKNMYGKEGQDELITSNGIAGALEGGYELEVGQRGNCFNFGLKYEYDHGSSADLTMQSLGFRVSYAFGFFRKTND